MLFLHLGPPGSGKTYAAVKDVILPNVRAGRMVVTNIPLVLTAFKEEEQELLTVVTESQDNPTPFLRVADWQIDWQGDDGVGPLLVLDEAHQFLARHNADKEVLNHIALHRKFGQDIFLITQTISQIHNVVRDKVQTTFKFRKATSFGLMSAYSRQTIDGTRGQKLAIDSFRYDKKIFPYYQSHIFGGVSEKMATKQKTVWSNWRFKVLAVALGVIAYHGYQGNLSVSRYFPSGGWAASGASTPPPKPSPPPQVVAVAPSPGVPAVPPPVQAPKPVVVAPALSPAEGFGPLDGKELQVAGVINGQSGGVAVVRAYVDIDGYLIGSVELEEMGYSVQIFGECGLRVTWVRSGVGKFVACRSLRVKGMGALIGVR